MIPALLSKLIPTILTSVIGDKLGGKKVAGAVVKAITDTTKSKTIATSNVALIGEMAFVLSVPLPPVWMYVGMAYVIASYVLKLVNRYRTRGPVGGE